MRFKPFRVDTPQINDRVFVRRHTADEITKGGLLLPEKAREAPPIGTVLSSTDPKLVPGMEVLFDAFGGRAFEIDGGFIALDTSEVIGTYERSDDGSTTPEAETPGPIATSSK